MAHSFLDKDKTNVFHSYTKISQEKLDSKTKQTNFFLFVGKTKDTVYQIKIILIFLYKHGSKMPNDNTQAAFIKLMLKTDAKRKKKPQNISLWG